MKSNELRIGNLIGFGKSYFQVYEIQEKCFYVLGERGIELKNTNCDLKPIPLTEEWLLKLGFELLYTGKSRKVYDFAKDLRFGYSNNHGLSNTQSAVTFVGNSFTHIKYVHQLQNLYFALTGSELTVA